MALDPNRWTLKTQEAFNAATESARSRNNPEVTPDHLLLAMLGQEATVVLPVLDQGRAWRPCRCATRLDDALAKLPRSYSGKGGASEVQLSRDLRETLDRGRRRADRPRRRVPLHRAHPAGPGGDRLGGQPRRPAGGAARRSGAATGSPARTPRSSTRPWRSTAGTSPRRPARASSTRSSAATRRSAGSSRSSPAGPRTTPSSSASPVWARPPSWRAWPGASSRATSPRA